MRLEFLRPPSVSTMGEAQILLLKMDRSSLQPKVDIGLTRISLGTGSVHSKVLHGLLQQLRIDS